MKKQLRLFASTILLHAFALSSAHAYNERWHVIDNEGLPVATDCGDCEEELGIIIACTGKGQPAKVTVNGAAAQKGSDGAASQISFIIDGQIFNKSATTVEFGLIGFTPVFQLPPNDPLVEAFQGGQIVTMRFNGEQSSLKLNGSRAALDTFKQGCGWNAASSDQQPQSTVFGVQPGEVHTQPNQDEELWYTSSYDRDTSNEINSLTYGIPETDAIAIIANCKKAMPGVIDTKFLIDFGNTQTAQLVNINIAFDDGTISSLPGFVFNNSSEFAGIVLSLKSNDVFWSQLSSAKTITIGMQGRPNITLPGAAKAATHFISKCG